MNPQSKYILFYSNNCIHSREFLNQLYKNQPLFEAFIKVDVEKSKVNIPKCVTAVPTIIIRAPSMKAQVYTGDEVFNWYNKLLSRLDNASSKNNPSTASSSMGSGTSSSIGGVLDYDPCAMSGFSDGFAYLDDKTSKMNPLEHQFEFLSGGGGGNLMGNMSLDPTSQLKDKGQDKSELDARMEQLMAQRARDAPQQPNRKGGESVV
jgi:hypothetical protein